MICSICNKKRIEKKHAIFFVAWLFSVWMLSFVGGAILAGEYGAILVSGICSDLVAISAINETKRFCTTKCGGFVNMFGGKR